MTTSSDAGFFHAVHGGLWNRLLADRLPQIVVRAANEEDVIASVNFARANELKVVVRGGGHNWCQPTLRHGGLLLDLQDLNRILSIDEQNRKAVIQPIISNRDVQRALNPRGLAFASGHCPQVKASGYLLGGGMAWNPTVWGCGAENVEAVDLVTARGELIRASETENPDYFWAARGSGTGFFGVVTKFHIKLQPLPKAMHGSTYFFSLDDAPAVGSWLGKLAPNISPSVELSQFVIQAPQELQSAAAKNGGWICMVTAVAFEDTIDAAKAALRPLEDSPIRPLASSFATPTNFEEMFDASGALWPEGMRSRVEATFSNACPGEMMQAVNKKLKEAPSTATVFLFTIFCGPNIPSPHKNMALSMSAKVYGGPWTMWTDPADDHANTAWHHELTDQLRPFNVGSYIGESNSMERPGNAVQAFSPKNWQRLADLRSQYDPEGVFFGYFEGIAPPVNQSISGK